VMSMYGACKVLHAVNLYQGVKFFESILPLDNIFRHHNMISSVSATVEKLDETQLMELHICR